MIDSAPLRARLFAALRSPLLPLWAILALLPFARSAEAGVLACIVGAAFVLLRDRTALLATPAARLALTLWACYVLAAAFSLTMAIAPERSTLVVLGLLRYGPLMLYAAWALRGAGRARALMTAIAVLVALWTADAWIQALTGWSLRGAPEPHRLTGIFGAGDPKLGQVLAVLAPFVFETVRRRFGRRGLGLAFLFLLGPVLLAGSRAAWVTYAVVTLAFLWRETASPRRFLLGSAALGVIAVSGMGVAWQTSQRFDARMDRTLLALSGSEQGLNAALSYRLSLWGTTLRMIAAHPLTGVGVRGFRYAYPAYARPGDPFVRPGSDEGAFHAHQIVLEVLSETGAVGLALWLAGLVAAVRAWWRAGAAARARAGPATVALGAAVFPLNTTLAFYSAWWGLLFFWLLAVWAGALLAPPGKAEDAHGA